MSRYTYQARNRSGELFSGEIEAPSRVAAAMQIRQKGLWVTEISDDAVENTTANYSAKTGKMVTTGGPPTLKRIYQSLSARRPQAAQLVMLFRELAVLLGAGLPIHQALKMLSTGATGAYARLLTGLYTQVMQGNSFSVAISKNDLFSASIISLIRAGEAGGTLESILGTIADFEERRFANGEKLKSALLYPKILLLATALAFAVLIKFILPTFAAMLRNLDAELPFITRALLWLADMVNIYPLLLLGLAIFSCCLIHYIYEQPAARYYIDRAKLYVPLYGDLVNCSAWNNLCGTVAVLLENGIPLNEGLALARESVDNTYIAKCLQAIKESVESGKSLHQSLALCPEFPTALGELVLAGEEAGMLDTMLSRAAYFCNLRATNAADRLEALAQPAAIVFVGGLIAVFVLSVMMPILSLMDVLL